MRALALAALVLLPLAGVEPAAAEAPRDLVVTLRPGAGIPPASLPAGALALSLFPGYVVPDATPELFARLARDPAVERLDWAIPLERHGLALPASAHHSLTRAKPPGDPAAAGAGLTVAVVDSGIDATHPDLAGRVRANVALRAGKFEPAVGDADGHGTHVAGVLAAQHARYGGVAPGVELVGLDISQRFTTASAILAYDWLYANAEEHRIRVVVNAWGRVGKGEIYDPKDPELRAIDRLVASGVVVLFSASNHGPGPGTLSVEAMDPHVITVGATDAAGQLMAYSSRGPVATGDPALAWTKPDVVAPGDAVAGPRSAQSLPRESDPDALHTVYSGTSQAVPHVGGIVARMLQASPGLLPHEVARILRESAIDVGEPGVDDATGWGVVDARDALALASGGEPDRANLLVHGGQDVQRDQGDVAGTGGRGLFDLVSRPQVVWEAPFAVKLGARELRVEAEAEGARDVAVELVKDGRLVRTLVVEDPEPGVWNVRIRASVPVATRVDATYRVEMPAAPERALQMDGRNGAQAPAPPLPPPEARGLAVDAPFSWPILLGAAVVGALLAAAVMPARREHGRALGPPKE